MKKILLILLTTVILFSFSACIREETPAVDENVTEDTDINTELPDESNSENDQQYKIYFYEYDSVYGKEISVQYDDILDEDTLIYIYKSDRADTRVLAHNNRYAYISMKDEFFFLDLTNGEELPDIDGFDHASDSIYDIVGEDIPLISVISGPGKETGQHCLYDFVKREYLPDLIYDSIEPSFDRKMIICVNTPENAASGNTTESYLICADDLQVVISSSGIIGQMELGENLYYTEATPKRDGRRVIAVYNAGGEKKIDCTDITASFDKLITWEKVPDSDKKKYCIYNSNLEQEYESREYDGYYGLWYYSFGDPRQNKDSFCQVVIDDGYYCFINNDESAEFRICEKQENDYIHSILTSYGSNYSIDDPCVAGYERNVGDADNPIFEPAERPAPDSSLIHFIIEHFDVEIGTCGRAYEYYVSKDEGVIGRLVLNEVTGYSVNDGKYIYYLI